MERDFSEKVNWKEIVHGIYIIISSILWVIGIVRFLDNDPIQWAPWWLWAVTSVGFMQALFCDNFSAGDDF